MTALSKLVSVSPNRLSVIYITYSLHGCELVTFADDTALFVSSSDLTAVCDGLQEQLDSLTDYFKRWKIEVNWSKT
jgi:hypothetical protein